MGLNIVERIDGKKGRIAKLVGRSVPVKLNAIVLPKNALKYVIAHEVAHTISKKHGKSYWKIVETIYPRFDDGKRLLAEHEDALSVPLLNP
ncbi:MAG: M48 family metallopeptidase [Promethearchaeati archaeon SRVP18_Atabeyarchaeia-1]